jgi:hypothetical protein
MLPPPAEELAARRAELARSPTLQRLAARLRRLAQPLVDAPVQLAPKAMLSSDGGRCPHDGSRLEFDPLNAREHRCPRCGEVARGEAHDRAWARFHHLWLSERAIHLALLGGLLEDPALAAAARRILEAYAQRYRDYPNRDNALGPTRLFFSTYLESIWLVQIAIAASLLPDRLAPAFDAMMEESADLIASFDEGFSNRQVWHAAAQVAAGCRLGERGRIARGLAGLRALLSRGVTGDGLWHEGENYHLFALRGFLLAAELLRAEGLDLYRDDPRLGGLFEAPLLSLLPDLTLPARGDAPYGVSVRQPRFADLWEVGWARTGSMRLESLLVRLYAEDAPVGVDPGFADVAEQEQNRPPQRLDRASLSWKALRWMRADPPAAPPDEWQHGSRLLRHAGLAVLRPATGRCVTVECGGLRRGHGHPDLLQVSLFWDTPVLVDLGAGSYVSPQLHWYRSALAHNAPALAGTGQLGWRAWCGAFDERDGWAWCLAVAPDLLGAGTRVRRAVVVGPRYVVDVLRVEVPEDLEVDLPIHALPALEVRGGVLLHPARLFPTAAAGHEHGYDAITDARRLDPESAYGTVLVAGLRFGVHLAPRPGEVVLLACAPGPSDPRFADGGPVSFAVRRARGAGVWVQCYAPVEAGVARVEYGEGRVRVRQANGLVDRIELADHHCRVEQASGTVVTLSGTFEAPPSEEPPAAPPPAVRVPCPTLAVIPPVESWDRHVPADAVIPLGGAHYRRSEEPYGARGRFAARVVLFRVGSRIGFAADVVKQPLHFRPADAPDPRLDNESPDIHSDGIQVYVGTGGGWAGYLAVPEPDFPDVRIRSVRGTGGDPSRASAAWCRTDQGYRILVTVELGRAPAPGTSVAVNLVINEMYPDRVRRAGQLALAGGAGWVYLRGDRESPLVAAVAEVT